MPAQPLPAPLPPLQHLDDGCLSARLHALEARRSAQEAEVEALRWVSGWRQERSYLKACRVLSWQDVAQAFCIVLWLPNDSTAAARIGFACRLLGPCQPVPLSLLAAVPRPPLTLLARHLTACRLWF